MPTPVLGQYVERLSDGAVGRVTRLGQTHAQVTWDYDNPNRAAFGEPPAPKLTVIRLDRLPSARFRLVSDDDE